MDDIREELEKNYDLASAPEEQSPDPTKVNEQGEQTPPLPPVDEYLNAPLAYKKDYAETFKTLPPEIRKYLHERESEVEKGFGRVNNQLSGYKWVEENWETAKEIAKIHGFDNAKEYNAHLYKIAEALVKDPDRTFEAFRQVYGKQTGTPDQLTTQKMFTDRLSNVESQFNDFNQYMQQQQQAANFKAVEDFANSKNEDGSSKYPHIFNEEVGTLMDSLLNAGMAKNLEDAYNRAIWQVDGIRSELVKAQTQADLAKATKEAEKAKSAAFSPKGKDSGQGDNKNLSLRDQIAKDYDEIIEK